VRKLRYATLANDGVAESSVLRCCDRGDGLFGLTISQGAIANVLARVGKAITAPAEQIAAEVRASEVRCQCWVASAGLPVLGGALADSPMGLVGVRYRSKLFLGDRDDRCL
jgi:hypothetical protein